MNKNDYNRMAVASCKHCHSLYIVTDDLGNEVCGRCGSVNQVEVHKNIDEYFNKYGVKETT